MAIIWGSKSPHLPTLWSAVALKNIFQIANILVIQ